MYAIRFIYCWERCEQFIYLRKETKNLCGAVLLKVEKFTEQQQDQRADFRQRVYNKCICILQMYICMYSADFRQKALYIRIYIYNQIYIYTGYPIEGPS